MHPNIALEERTTLMKMQNGVGKTAIARVLAGLWAPESGTVSRPERGYNGVFVVPQRAYMVVGSLKDQYVPRLSVGMPW